MENLHAPTVPSGPTSSPLTNGEHANGRSLSQLEARKVDMEAEMNALSRVLDSHGVNMDTPLITPDGFPRADLDVAQIRTTRTRIIRLRNDYKALMAAIETSVHEHFARAATDAQPEEPLTNGEPITNGTPVLTAPFAKVNTVERGSPAESAGLRPNDAIRNFGYVNIDNHDGLRRVGECVRGNVGHPVAVKISRLAPSGRQELQLSLTPARNWGGNGLLGCHILPL